MKNKKTGAILLLLAGTFGLSFVNVSAQVAPPTLEELGAQLKAGPCKNNARLDAVTALFKQNGAADADIKVESYKELRNLVVTKKGRTADTIIIGAHYDKVDDGCGTIDNWSGI